MKPASIFLLAGAPAVGKSTTARALAARFPRSIHIPVDTLREMVVSGLELPGIVWSDELSLQISLARASAIQMALNYRKAGFSVVIDDFWDPNSLLHEYNELFEQPNVSRILIYPSQNAALERSQKREGSGESGQYIAGGIRQVYEHLDNHADMLRKQGWILADTTDKNVEESVGYILSQTG